jgi:hypothetical protein
MERGRNCEFPLHLSSHWGLPGLDALLQNHGELPQNLRRRSGGRLLGNRSSGTDPDDGRVDDQSSTKHVIELLEAKKTART